VLCSALPRGRPHPTDSSLRIIYINKAIGEDFGVEIRNGDGWYRKHGVFVHGLDLGSQVDNKGLLQVRGSTVQRRG